MSWRYRCTRRSCRARVSRRRQLYIDERVCKVCGGRLADRTAERAAKRRRETCHCDAWPHPHSIYSDWCQHQVGPKLADPPDPAGFEAHMRTARKT